MRWRIEKLEIDSEEFAHAGPFTDWRVTDGVRYFDAPTEGAAQWLAEILNRVVPFDGGDVFPER